VRYGRHDASHHASEPRTHRNDGGVRGFVVWMILFPGLFLAMVVLSFNLVGDALRDRLDPKLRRVV